MKRICVRSLILLCIISICATSVCGVTTLIPGGQVIGLELLDNTVTIAAFDENLGDAAKAAGLAQGDKILKIDNTPVHTAEDVRKALACSDGQVKLSIVRGAKTKTLTLTPPLTQEGPRLGVYLRQGTTGLGTVTYYNPETDTFAALGHGVNTSAGELVRLETGRIFSANVFSVKKGKPGTPGQLLGSVTSQTPVGTLKRNTDRGVFGASAAAVAGDAMPVAKANEIKTGSATIRSTVGGTTLREYSVEILKIYANTGSRNRNMLIKITDPALLAATGGIVQGMSGSPIIQNGKLVGAVTHVLINDPTMGYGIFIENMLDAAA